MYKLSDKAVLFLPLADVEASALRQIQNTASMSFIFKHIAVMPDCHFGRGATVGTVLATQGAIIPAAVGVDIGCGMVAVRTPLRLGDLPEPARIRQEIERRIPMSAGHNNRTLTETAAARVAQLETLAQKDYGSIAGSWRLQLGTLGGGNHFIELATDEHGDIWATLHSGSRGIGNTLGNLHIKKAQRCAATLGISLPDRDLAYLTEHTPEFDDYIADVQWAQEFARLNRDEMMDRVMTVLSHSVYGTSPASDLRCRGRCFSGGGLSAGVPVWALRPRCPRVSTSVQAVARCGRNPRRRRPGTVRSGH